jgi:hypothetical protein
MSLDYSSDAFGNFDSSGNDDTPELPSFAHIFHTSDNLIEYAQGRGIEAGYSLVIRRSISNDSGEKNRVYL